MKEGVIIENKGYKLIGILNLHKEVTDFVYPVFAKDGKYYLENSKNNIIKSFSLIKNKELLDKIKTLNLKDVQVVNSKLIYSVGDQKPHTFQIDNNKILICDLNYFIKFLKEFKAKDEFLRFMIKSFVYQNDKPIQKTYKKQ